METSKCLKEFLGKKWFCKFRSGVNPAENAGMSRASSDKKKI